MLNNNSPSQEIKTTFLLFKSIVGYINNIFVVKVNSNLSLPSEFFPS